MNTQEIRNLRNDLLLRIYEKVGGQLHTNVTPTDFAEELGVEEGMILDAIFHMKNQRLLEAVTLEGSSSLSSLGIVEAERLALEGEGAASMTALEMRNFRTNLLIRIYEKTGGQLHADVKPTDFAEEMGIEEEMIHNAVLHMKNQGFLENMKLDGSVSISSRGIMEAERLALEGKSISSEAKSMAPPGEVLAFLCHASEDKPAVRKLHSRLLQDGIATWFDEECLLPGQNWKVEIRKAIRQSRAMVICLSPTSVSKTGYVQKEIKLGLDVLDEHPEGSIFLIPVKLKECEVPDRLRELHWVSLDQERGYGQLVQSLRKASKGGPGARGER